MSTASDSHARTEIRDGMRIPWHQPIPTDDGLVLRADVYRPVEDVRCPVILTYGIYAKGLAYQDGYPLQWEKMVADYPEILAGSTNKYQNWETTDPERWVPHGYAVVRVDSRGAGWSPGFMDPGCPREIEDLYQCIEWAGTQPWSNGKVGMLGISYYAGNQWRVAGRHPPHLAAIIPWEGQNDRYRDSGYHGGILCQFQERWAKHQVANIQYGRGDRAKKNPNTGESVAGPVTLSDEALAKNRVDAFEELKKHPLDDEWHRARSADLSLVRTPLLTCANWGGQGIHPRGNFNGFTETPDDTPKWLAPAARAAQYPPSRRAVRAARRERVAAGPHPVDEVLPRSREPGAQRETCGAGGPGRVRSTRQRCDVLDAAPGEGNGDYRPHGGQALRLIVDCGR